MKQEINKQTYEFLLDGLIDYHGLFYALAKQGAIYLDDKLSVETAGVSYDKDCNVLDISFHPKFWKNITWYDIKFVLCHELLHIFMNHGTRIKALDNKEKANIAADLVVNHRLASLDGFDFIRGKLSIEGDLCWIDTVFNYPDKVPLDASLEGYYMILPEQSENKQTSSFDDHGSLPTEEEDFDVFEMIEDAKECNSQSKQKDFACRVQNEIDSNETNLNDLRQAASDNHGSDGGNKTIDVSNVKPSKDAQWYKFILNWLQKQHKHIESEKDSSRWTRPNRRLISIDTGLILPYESEIDEKIKSIDLWIFQDTSGSCKDHAKTLFALIKSLPIKKLGIRIFGFDVSAYEIDIKEPKLQGFAGTNFDAIENKIQQLIKKENRSYPKLVFVITDGKSTRPSPQYPKRWCWFLMENSEKDAIPPESFTYPLHQISAK